MAGYILVLAIIILGGVIATLGDRLGSRVGKARLSLFNLRPKSTAVLVTILTGSIISASTLGILLATSRQLRDAVFRIDDIIRQSRTVRDELTAVQEQKADIQAELSVARGDLTESVRRLKEINESLEKAVARQKVSEQNLKRLQGRYEQAQTTLKQFSQQATLLRSQIQDLASQRRRLTAERQTLIVQRDQIQERLKTADSQKQRLEAASRRVQQDLQSAIRQQSRLEKAVLEAQEQFQAAQQAQVLLQQQRTELEAEIESLEQNRQQLVENLRVLLLGLRRGNVTIRAGQVLASGIVSDLNNLEEATQALNTLLLEARKTAIIRTNPQDLDPQQQVVQMSQADVEQLIQSISDGQTYAIRLLSGLNYLEGEDQVLVVPHVFPNRLIFSESTVVSTIRITPADLSDTQLLVQLNKLFSQANQRAIDAGILPDPVSGTVGAFQQTDLFRFVIGLQSSQTTTPIEIQAITTDNIFSAGPLKLQLVARQGQSILLRSESSP